MATSVTVTINQCGLISRYVLLCMSRVLILLWWVLQLDGSVWAATCFLLAWRASIGAKPKTSSVQYNSIFYLCLSGTLPEFLRLVQLCLVLVISLKYGFLCTYFSAIQKTFFKIISPIYLCDPGRMYYIAKPILVLLIHVTANIALKARGFPALLAQLSQI